MLQDYNKTEHTFDMLLLSPRNSQPSTHGIVERPIQKLNDNSNIRFQYNTVATSQSPSHEVHIF